jgi:hypothetical protein
MQKLSWKEKYAGILVLIIGIIYLLMQIASIASNRSISYGSQQEAFVINKNELFSDIKTWLVIIMGIAAGFLLLKNKTLGWVLGLPVLLLFATTYPCIEENRWLAYHPRRWLIADGPRNCIPAGQVGPKTLQGQQPVGNADPVIICRHWRPVLFLTINLLP